MLAGWIQSVLADNIPERAENKLDPVQLGFITIVLTLVSLICGNCLWTTLGRTWAAFPGLLGASTRGDSRNQCKQASR